MLNSIYTRMQMDEEETNDDDMLLSDNDEMLPLDDGDTPLLRMYFLCL